MTLDRRHFMQAGVLTLGTVALPTSALAAFRFAVGDVNLSDADIAALADELDGALILQDNYIPSFEDAARVFNSRFNDIRPLAIAKCKNSADVQSCMKWCIEHDIHFVARAGGHSYCGWSSCEGLVIDVGDIQDKSFNASTHQVTFGSGLQLVDVYQYLGTNFQRAIPGGTCPTVGLTGLTLGGGQGLLSRKYGMTCDNLVAANVVLYDGTEVYEITCDADNNPKTLVGPTWRRWRQFRNRDVTDLCHCCPGDGLVGFDRVELGGCQERTGSLDGLGADTRSIGLDVTEV